MSRERDQRDAPFKHYCKRGPYYNLILTDYAHEGMGGLELSRAIRKRNPAQAIAAFTADGSKEINKLSATSHTLLAKGEVRPVENLQFLREVIATKQKTTGPTTVRAKVH